MNKIIALLFISISLNGVGQSWQKIVDFPFSVGRSMAYGIRVIDDTIFVASHFVELDSTCSCNPPKVIMSKHDISNGDVVDYKIYYSQSYDYSSFSDGLPGYNHLYAGFDKYIRLGVNYFNENQDSINVPSCLVIDKNLSVADSFSIPAFVGDDFSILNGNRMDDDGNILLFGSRNDDLNMDSDSAHTLLVKMTPWGEQLWAKKYHDSEAIAFLETLSDGDIIFNCGYFNGSLIDAKRIIKTNDLGEEQWRMTFGGMYSSANAAITEASNNKIILANSWNYDYVNEPGVDWWYRTWLQIQKVQDLGESYVVEQDKKYVPTSNVLETYGVEEMSDSNLIVWGRVQNNDGNTYDSINQIWTQPYERGFLMKLNSALDSLWFRTYFYPDDDWLQMYSDYRISDVAPLAGGGFVTAGWGRLHDLEGKERIWLMRLDEYGCLEPGCQNVNPTEIVVGYENSIQAYPNPVVDECTLQWNAELASKVQANFSESQIIIIDAMGREVQRYLVNNFGSQFQMQIDMTSFPSGLYQAHWVSGGSWLDSVQIIKQ